jgi:hypothetical protein
MQKFKPVNDSTAWLVGHGLKSDSVIGTKAKRKGFEIDAIIGWCSKNLFSASRGHVLSTLHPQERCQKNYRHGIHEVLLQG